MEEVEIWKDIPEYEGLYQVSNFGRVKSLPRNTTKGGILKPRKNRGGYLQLFLSYNGKRKTFTVHKLVATAFLKNENNLPCVNHIDENKENNHVDNLEFCDIRYNNCYGSRLERQSKSMKGKIFSDEHKRNISKSQKGKIISEETKKKMSESHKGDKNYWYGKHLPDEVKQKMRKPKSEEHKRKLSKPTIQYTKNMIFVCEWTSVTQASRELHIQISAISACCRGERKTAGDYIWRYKETTI